MNSASIRTQEVLANYYGGEFVGARDGSSLANIDPATGSKISDIPSSGVDDVSDAVAAATQAFPKWSSLSVDARASYLSAIADLLERDKELFALAESFDTGKPLSLARSVDIPRAITNFRFFASAITQWSSELYQNGNTLHGVLREPLGVVACISPWNLPLYLLTWKIAPALAAGNCVIAKPSELTPTTAFLLSKICHEVGLPSGVLNILHGTGPRVGAALCAHPSVVAISFTGGTATGAEISRVAAPSLKKLSLELGGKNPAILFDDCDLEQAVQTTIRSSFSNQGQICLCTSRIYVEHSIFEQFTEKFIEGTRLLVVGDPLDDGTNLGSLISKSHLSKVQGYIELAKGFDGGTVEGGEIIQLEGRCRDGSFMRPAIITGLSNKSRVNQEEIFGPAVTITPFNTDEEAFHLANDTSYGLAASVWTRDYDRAHRSAQRVKAGLVWINSWMVRDIRTPFGGMKQSGVGREGGVEALRFFTEPKSVCFSMSSSI